MDIKILTSTPNSKRNYFVIGTHNGAFHADEVVAAAILCLLHKNENIRIVRSRTPAVLSKCDICIDVGGGRYDHHQPTFSLKRDNELPYASAGLVWRDFGPTLTEHFAAEIQFAEKPPIDSAAIVEMIDSTIIQFVDAEDNGIDLGFAHCMSFISTFLPAWYEKKPNFEAQFLKALSVCLDILQQKIKETIAKIYAESCLKERLCSKRYFSDTILEIPTETIPWLEIVCKINEEAFTPVNFVIFPYPAGGWAAQCVPPAIYRKFKQRVSFPKQWAGQTAQLAAISGIPEATFCHNGCFFVRAESKDAVISMCKVAMKQAK